MHLICKLKFTELRAELIRMEKVIEQMVGPQIEKYNREQRELKLNAGKGVKTKTKPTLPQIKATVSLIFVFFFTYGFLNS